MSDPSLLREIESLRARLAEAEDTVRAIREGEVDALVVEGTNGPRIYTLKGADEGYRMLVERMQEGALSLARDGCIVYGNRSFAQMLRLPLEQVIGTAITRFVAEGLRPALVAMLQEAEHTSVRRELALQRADGTSFPALLSLSPLRTEEVGVIAMIASDLSEQKRNEEIAAREAFLRSILDQALEPVIVCDQAGVITHANRAALALGRGDLVGRPFAEATSLVMVEANGDRLADPASLTRRIADALAGRGVQGLEVRSPPSDGGEERHHLLSAGPLYDGRAGVAGCIVMLTEITERRRSEEHQKILLAELSHRVKNTLATVRSIAAQTMRTTPAPDSFGPAFDGRLKALAVAHNILTSVGWGEAELGQLIRRVVTPYRSARPDSLALSGPVVRLLARQVVPITLILHELATNALKYGPLSAEQGRVEVAWSIEHDGAERVACLRWVESGGPPVEGPQRKGFGTALIERSIAHELDGRVAFDYRQGGLVCELTFALVFAPGDDLLRQAESSAKALRSNLASRTRSAPARRDPQSRKASRAAAGGGTRRGSNGHRSPTKE